MMRPWMSISRLEKVALIHVVPIKTLCTTYFTKRYFFGVGPAGTGKTYLAVAAAVDMLERNEIQRILLVRPAVEAGEKLGFYLVI